MDISSSSNTKTDRRELKVRDFYQRVGKKSGEIKTTRGLGQSFSEVAIEAYFKRCRTHRPLVMLMG